MSDRPSKMMDYFEAILTCGQENLGELYQDEMWDKLNKILDDAGCGKAASMIECLNAIKLSGE